MKRAAVAVSCLLILSAAGLRAQTAGPAISFEGNAVVASGLSPGKAVYWFAVEREIDSEYSITDTERFDAGTVAADGTARLELGRPAAQRSVWAVADLDGGYAVAAPPGYTLRRLLPPRTSLGPGTGTQADGLVDQRPYIVGLVVRPGVGAWSFSGGDGGPRDEDGANDGHLRFALDGLTAFPGSPAAPAKIGTDDLWFVVDPRQLEISVQKGGIAQ